MVEAGLIFGRCNCCIVADILVADSERCDTVHRLSCVSDSVFGRLAGLDLVDFGSVGAAVAAAVGTAASVGLLGQIWASG